jgi:recombination endonuclease VII
VVAAVNESAACTCDPEAYDLGPEGQKRYFPDRGCPQHGDPEWIAAQDAAPVDYAAMLAAQGGVCAICGNPPKTRRLHIDHDHRTGKIRGLLCFTCNRYILGKYATVAKLRAAADYLERGGVT